MIFSFCVAMAQSTMCYYRNFGIVSSCYNEWHYKNNKYTKPLTPNTESLIFIRFLSLGFDVRNCVISDKQCHLEIVSKLGFFWWLYLQWISFRVQFLKVPAYIGVFVSLISKCHKKLCQSGLFSVVPFILGTVRLLHLLDQWSSF